MKFIVEKKSAASRRPVLMEGEAYRSNLAKTVMARHGGRKLLPDFGPQLQATGVAVSMSPTFGLPRQLKRSG